jgi:hypothetical protein
VASHSQLRGDLRDYGCGWPRRACKARIGSGLDRVEEGEDGPDRLVDAQQSGRRQGRYGPRSGRIEAASPGVEQTIHRQSNGIRHAMNGFVIALGTYVQSLTQLAVQSGEKIGPVSVDMGDTACKVLYSPEYIQKARKRGVVGKKRKTARLNGRRLAHRSGSIGLELDSRELTATASEHCWGIHSQQCVMVREPLNVRENGFRVRTLVCGCEEKTRPGAT